ncbi:hypothetical protein [Ottowia sp. VDI28]|uniref:hypothetical protein n=1 Tax=Ottowia sp. VDI28 TaxID=3133968 RepID=UPI003C30DA7C
MTRWTKFNPFFLVALSAMALTSLLLGAGVQAQVRNFPQDVKRAQIVFAAPPEVLVNGQREFLAPGVRVRNQQNLLALTGSLHGQMFTVNYLRDPAGLIREIWILTPDEATSWPDGTPMPVGKSVFMGG